MKHNIVAFFIISLKIEDYEYFFKNEEKLWI